MTAAAEVDLAVAADWYDARVPGLGRLLIEAVHALLNSLPEFPEKHPLAFDTTRKAVLRRFPYSVVYRLEPTAIQILGVLPNRADPEQLARRATSTAHIQ